MDSGRADGFIARHTAFFEDGDTQHIAGYYPPPIPVYFGDQMKVFSTLEEFRDDVLQRRKVYRSAGILGLQGSISAIELVRNRQFRMWVQWDYRFADRIEYGGAEVIYYCTETADSLEVQMVQTNRSYMQEIGEVSEPAVTSRPAHG